MKRILILLLALMPVMAGAQELDIDKENNVITVSYIRDTDLTQDDILTQILAYNKLNNVVHHGNMIAGDIVPTKLNYEAAGYTRMKVPLYMSNGNFTARMIIWYKEGRYKVEVYNLRFVDTQSSLPGTTFLSEVIDAFGFDIAAKLALNHIVRTATFHTINDWE